MRLSLVLLAIHLMVNNMRDFNMTYTELLDADWGDIKDKITKEDKKKLKEINEISSSFCEPPIRQKVRRWCISKDREQKLNQLGL